ncbi:MAG: hypothetical protein N3A02_01615, partial [Rectinema sp.]|nr:hypothetical protein [Rectinema sp.]
YQPLWWYIEENKLYEKPFELSYGFHFTSHRKSEDWNPGDDGYLYENSFYMDLAQAFINTIAYVQHRWMERLLSAKTAVEKPRLTAPPSDCATIKDVDRLFLQWFGVDLDNPPGTSATAKFATKLGNTTVWMHSYEPHAGQWLGRSETSVEMWQNYSATNHIKAMKDNGNTEEAKAMERVLNDFRMSVFGASPQYPDFKFLDMDGDGKAYASDSSAEPTSAAQRDPARYWSLSGYFVFQKSRYYRVFARGEVFDLYRRIPISQADYEVVVAVDRLGDPVLGHKWDVNNNDLLPGIKPETRNLYQRWHDNRYTMNRPRLTFEATTAP